MLNWMRDPTQALAANIMSGLIELCDYLKQNLEQRDIMYELGSFAGESAEVFARYFDVVHCVDPWSDNMEELLDPRLHATPKEIEASFDERATLSGKMIKHRCRGVDIVTSVLDASLDFVYIDADHHYETALADIRAWWPKVRQGGFLGGHDYHVPANPPSQEVVRALSDFFAGNLSIVKTFPDTSWIVRKP